MKASIETSPDVWIVTEDPAVIAQARTDGKRIEMWYDADNPRPEETAKIQAEQARKVAQDIIDSTTNRPNIIRDLIKPENEFYNDKTVAERATMDWPTLAEYHSQMVLKKNRIAELIKLKGLIDDKFNWDTEGAKTFTQIEADIKTEKAKLDVS